MNEATRRSTSGDAGAVHRIPGPREGRGARPAPDGEQVDHDRPDRVRDTVHGLWAAPWDLVTDPAWHPEPDDTPPDVTLPVLVGIDGSDGSAQALEWALREAAAHGAPVRVVTAWSWDARMLRAGGRIADRMRQVQEAQLGRVLGRVGGTGCPIDTVLAEGDPASVLLEQSRTARLLVVGSHAGAGHGLGSVARACLRFAHCPVVVVPVPAVA